MNKSNRPVIVYGNDFSLNISVKRYDAQTDDYIDLDLSQVTDLEVYLTCSNNNTTIPLDFTTSGSYIKCQVQYRFLAPQTSYGIVVEAFDEENKHFRFEALPREGFLVVSNTSGFKPAENVDVVDIKARIGWGNTIDAYTKEEMDEIINPISERLTDAEGTLEDHTTQIDDIDNNVAINTEDIATNKTNIANNTRDIRALATDVENKQDVLVSGKNIKTINNQSIVGSGNVIVGGADYSKEYFTIESLADNNTIRFTPYSTNTLSYSTDNGRTWTEGREVTVNNGDKVWWKGSNLSCNYDGPGRFISNRNFKVSGNIMSLEFDDDFVGQTTITKMYQFCKLFTGCTKIVDAKDLILPATTLVPYCYQGMFNGCTSLTKAPELPATRLTTHCYDSMFYGCTSLTKSPELPATTLEESCYYRMFNGCTNLTHIKMLATDISASQCLDAWVNNVASSGTMITSGKVTLPKNSENGIPTGWTELQYADPAALAAKQDVLVSGTNIKTINNESILGEGNITIEGGGGSSEPVDYSKEYFTIESLADNNTITFTPYGTNVLSYSTDNGTTWTEGNEVTVNNGDKVLWKGVLTPEMEEYYASGKFTSTENINVQGNIMSLKYSDNFEDQLTISDDYLFVSLFVNCTTLIDTHNLILPATTLAANCYNSMFYGCTSLVEAPELPATTLASGCYESMFFGCTSLTKSPELPAITLSTYCYDYMFYGCTQLTKAPELPATMLFDYCYAFMFQGCTSLTKAPELPAITLVASCYASMFQDCTRLQSVKMLATEITDDGLTYWMYNVASSGTMITSGKVELPKNSENGIPTGWTELQYADPSALANKQDTLVSGTNIKTINNESILGSGNITIEGGGSSEEIDYSKEYFTIESLADNNTITFTPYGTNVLSYSTDNGTTWTEGNEVTVNNGDKVLWKGSDLVCEQSTSGNGCGTFSSTGNINVSGNIMSLEFGDQFAGQTTLTKQYQFMSLFNGCTLLIDAHNLILPATQLSQFCYAYMFASSKSLVKAPRLQALSLAVQCYRSMFEACTSLQDAPELPATTLAWSCYSNMFQGCTSLIKAPELRTTTLAYRCYYSMFRDCTSLTKAPELLATTLATSCYEYMFQGCSKLSYVTMLATQFTHEHLNQWMVNVSAKGIMITSGKGTLNKNSASGIPTGWTELQYTDPSKFDIYVQSTTPGLKIEVVDALPATPVANTIYLVRDVSYNLTTATSVSELEPGQGNVVYYYYTDITRSEITSASPGQIIGVSPAGMINDDRPDGATEGVEGSWENPVISGNVDITLGGEPGSGFFTMPAEDVNCIAQYDWIEQQESEPEG